MNTFKLSDQPQRENSPLNLNIWKFLLLSYITPDSSTSSKELNMFKKNTEVHKPKIGFSIDSIVGDEKDKRSHHNPNTPPPSSPSSTSPSSPEKSKTDEFQKGFQTADQGRYFHPFHQLRLPLHNQPPPHGSNRSPPPGRTSPLASDIPSTTSITDLRKEGEGGEKNEQSNASSPSQSPKSSDVPSSPHEIHRPLVSTASLHHRLPGSPGMIPGQPSPHLPIGHGLPPQFSYPPGMLNFALAAATAAAQQGHPPMPHHPGIPGWIPPGHPGVPSQHHPHAPPTSHPLFPWLLAKHSRLFPPRFGPGPDLPGFLFQPFRKPKRIRTAFSPSQLLKLEHAFEKNHYVVGAERKQLAKSLSLSETQVKVWFQNRRTKHKRVEQEEVVMKKCDGERSSDLPSSGLSTTADSSTRNYSEGMSEEEEDEEGDEELVMDDDYSDEEIRQGHPSHLHLQNRIHQIHKSYS